MFPGNFLLAFYKNKNDNSTQGKWPTGHAALKGMYFEVYQVHYKGDFFNIVSPTDLFGLIVLDKY